MVLKEIVLLFSLKPKLFNLYNSCFLLIPQSINIPIPSSKIKVLFPLEPLAQIVILFILVNKDLLVQMDELINLIKNTDSNNLKIKGLSPLF